ncbi:MAG: hypothetical protein ACFFCS_03505 [Candidatus Hodarchaeota archaeon]
MPKKYNKTMEEKRIIARYTREHGFDEASKHFGVARSTIQRWVKEIEEKEGMSSNGERFKRVANKKERDKIIEESRKFGGFGLRDQTLKLKDKEILISLSRVYADDGLINLKKKFTVILIPEFKGGED